MHGYADLRDKAGPSGALLVDFVAIHLLPTLQVFAACLPLYIICQHPVAALNGLDIIAAVVTAGAVIIEWRADTELHRFLKIRQPGEIINSGLWSWSRHPNYFGELSFWFGLMLFGLAASPANYIWVIPGALLMAAQIRVIQ